MAKKQYVPNRDPFKELIFSAGEQMDTIIARICDKYDEAHGLASSNEINNIYESMKDVKGFNVFRMLYSWFINNGKKFDGYAHTCTWLLGRIDERDIEIREEKDFEALSYLRGTPDFVQEYVRSLGGMNAKE